MRKLTFTSSRGENITIGDSAPLLVTKLEGTGAVGVDIQTQKSPYQDGVTYLDSLLEPRQLSMEGVVIAHHMEEIFTHRRKLANVFNPKLGPGTLRYEYNGGVKEIQAVADGSPVFPDRTGQPAQQFMINLLCPNPFWLDEYEESEEMAAWIGGLSFPLSLGTMFAIRGTQMNFFNTGDVATPVTIEFNGPATTPKVENLTTGEYLKVNRDIGAGDKLVLTTAFGNKRVEIHKADGSIVNAFNWIDLESVFWQLEPGKNSVQYSAESGTETATVLVKWRNRYVGV